VDLVNVGRAGASKICSSPNKVEQKEMATKLISQAGQ